jgi:hypothetical protein
MVAYGRDRSDMPLFAEKSCRIVRSRGAIACSLDSGVAGVLGCESPPDA